ncbi:MAG: GDP-mannose 4,6-dehydratase [Candidatus Zixiibacteriota bacterium]
MNMFITGIDGFIGSHLAEYLLQNNENVWGLIRHDSASRNIVAIETMLNLIEGDLLELDALQSIIKSVKPKVLIHLAGQTLGKIAMQNPHQTMQTNILGTLNILEAVRKNSPDTKIIIGTSCDIHEKEFSSGKPIYEETPLAPDSPLAASHASSAIIAREYAKTYKMDIVIARILALIGPRQSKRYVVSEYANKICKAKLGRTEKKIKVGKLTAKRDFLDVRDAARVIYMLSGKTKHGRYTICSGRQYKLRELLDKLMEIAGESFPIEVTTDRIRNVDVPTLVGDPSRLKEEFQFEPEISIEESLFDIYRYWYNRLERNDF